MVCYPFRFVFVVAKAYYLIADLSLRCLVPELDLENGPAVGVGNYAIPVAHQPAAIETPANTTLGKSIVYLESEKQWKLIISFVLHSRRGADSRARGSDRPASSRGSRGLPE